MVSATWASGRFYQPTPIPTYYQTNMLQIFDWQQHGVDKPTIADNFAVFKKCHHCKCNGTGFAQNSFSIIITHTRMSPNDIHNSTLLTTLTFNDFNLDNNIDTSKCRITLLLIVLIIISPFISVSINLCIVFCFFLFCFLFRFSVVFFLFMTLF